MTAALPPGAGAVYVAGVTQRRLAHAFPAPATNDSPGLTMTTPAQPVRRADAHDVLGAARTWLDKDGRVALATVVGTWGSAPVRVGGQMVIAADGRVAGAVLR